MPFLVAALKAVTHFAGSLKGLVVDKEFTEWHSRVRLASRPCWSVHSVCLSFSGDPESVAGEYGRHSLYKMLGYFSLVGLLRLHSLLGDYYQAIKVLENIELNKKVMICFLCPPSQSQKVCLKRNSDLLGQISGRKMTLPQGTWKLRRELGKLLQWNCEPDKVDSLQCLSNT